MEVIPAGGVRGSCSKTCGTGFQDRNLRYTTPAPAHGGQSCPGSSTQSISCTIRPCPGDYSFHLSLAIIILTLESLTVRQHIVVQYTYGN